MISELLSIIGQAGIFILGVYLQKYIRKRIYSKEQGKKIKQTMRILTCAIVTLFILFYNYQQTCVPLDLTYSQCFYININFNQIFHVLIANAILFGAHIYEKFVASQVDYSNYSSKSVLFAPLLQELLFRASFFRTSAHQISIWILAAVFSLSHLHKPLRKLLKGKNPNKKEVLNQLVFTYIFGCYSFYYLSACFALLLQHFRTSENNQMQLSSYEENKFYHLGCIVAIILFNYISI